jgi:hypothetical protein
LSYDDLATPRSSYEEVAELISNEMVQAAKEIQHLTRKDNGILPVRLRGLRLATRAYALIFAASPLANGNDDEFARALVDDQGRRLLLRTIVKRNGRESGCRCKDVNELGVYDLYTAAFSTTDNGPHDRPTIAPPAYSEFPIRIGRTAGEISIPSNLIVIYLPERYLR